MGYSTEISYVKECADFLLRNYLTRCFSEISKNYPAIQKMTPEQGADHLIALRNEGKIEIKLKVVNEIITCQIEPLPVNN